MEVAATEEALEVTMVCAWARPATAETRSSDVETILNRQIEDEE